MTKIVCIYLEHLLNLLFSINRTQVNNSDSLFVALTKASALFQQFNIYDNSNHFLILKNFFKQILCDLNQSVGSKKINFFRLPLERDELKHLLSGPPKLSSAY